MRGYLAGLTLLCTSGCIWDPASRSPHESSQPKALSGYAAAAIAPMLLKARNYDTGELDQVGAPFLASAAEGFSGSGLFPWSVTLPKLDRKYWAPSTGLGVTNRTIGRLEIRGFQDSTQLLTFTQAAQQCTYDRIGAGESHGNAGSQCSDGQELVLFDNSGYDMPAEPLSWTVVGAKIVDDVSVKVVKYLSDGLAIYGLVCAPRAEGTFPTALYNHGGGLGTATDEALGCVNWAKHGWVLAMSSYRGERLRLPASWGVGTEWLSQGVVETSLGEIKDVLRLLEITRAQTNVDRSRVLMYGLSHGASITTRAVQSGAAVQVAAAMMPSNDWAQTFNDCVGSTDAVCKGLMLKNNDGATPPSQSPLSSMLGGTPAMNPNSYAWRSPSFFAADLAARKDVKFLMQHGIADTSVRAYQSCKLAEQAWGTSVQAFRVPSNGSPEAWSTAPVSNCSQAFVAGKRPSTSWPHNRYLMLYDGVIHWPAGAMVKDWVNFVNSLGWGIPY